MAQGLEDAHENMTEQLGELRIDAEVKVMTSETSIRETIQANSKFSDITFLGINLDEDGSDAHVYEEVEMTNEQLKGNIFVTRSWEELDIV